MVKGEVRIIKDLKIIILNNENGFNIFKFECLFCLNKKDNEEIGRHFNYFYKKKEYYCKKRK